MEIKIYTLSSTRNPDDIRYVGKTKQSLNRRLQGHKTDAKKYKSQSIFSNHNYNWINHEIESGYEIIISELDSRDFEDKEDWKWFEQYWISQLKAWGFHLNNLTDGGDGNQNQKMSPQSIKRRADKIRGIPRDSETKKKISEALFGRILTEEIKNKVKASVTELQGKKINQFDLNGNLIKEWESISEAANALNIDRANIGHCCAHKLNHNTAGGFIWRYYDDETSLSKYLPSSVCQLDLSSNIIEIFRNYEECHNKTGISIASISKCITGKISNVKGFKFKKYKDL